MRKIKVSVIIPIYNMEKYLEECLETVICQTLKEIEMICVNDGSLDRSEEILRRYAQNDGRIRVISKQNEGVGRARNDGMEIARGKYVCFMDPDDWYPDKNTLKEMYLKAEEYGVMICGGSFSEQTGDKLITEFTGVKSKYKFDDDRLMKYSEYQFDYGYHRFIYNLDFLKKNQIVFPEYIRFQDPPFFIKAMTRAKIFYAMSRVTYRYRVGTQKINWTDKKLLHLLYGLRDGIQMSGENNLSVLHKIMVERIGKNYYNWYDDRVEHMSCEMTIAIFEICDAVKPEILKKEKRYWKYVTNLIDLGRKSYKINHQEWDVQSEELQERIEYYIKRKYVELGAQKNTGYLREWSGQYKVSVIIPIHNVESHLEECIQSVMNQTLKEIEIICVNDGSSDGSVDVAYRMAEKDHRTVIIEKENEGPSSTRNAGIQRARGEYIVFLDSDDFLKEDALEKLWEIAWRENLDDIFFWPEILCDVEELSEQCEKFIEHYKRNGEYTGVWNGQDLFVEMMRHDDFKPSVCLQFVRRKFLQDNSITFYPGIIHEDNLFTHQVLTLAEKISCVQDKLCIKCVRENSIMAKKRGIQNAYDYFVVAQEALKFLEKKKVRVRDYYADAVCLRINQCYDMAREFIIETDRNEIECFLDNLEIENRMIFKKIIVDASVLKKRNEEDEKLIRKQEQIINRLMQREKEVRNSYSYRIGHKIVVPLAKLKSLLRKCMQAIKRM